MLYMKAIRAAWTEFRRTLDLERPRATLRDEVYTWPETVTHFLDISEATGLEVKDYGSYQDSPDSARWRVTLHRESTSEPGVYRYISGVATCVSHDDIRDVVRLERGE